MEQCVQSSSSSQCPVKQEAEPQRADGFPQLQQISHHLATDLYNVSDRRAATRTHSTTPPAPLSPSSHLQLHSRPLTLFCQRGTLGPFVCLMSRGGHLTSSFTAHFRADG